MGPSLDERDRRSAPSTLASTERRISWSTWMSASGRRWSSDGPTPSLRACSTAPWISWCGVWRGSMPIWTWCTGVPGMRSAGGYEAPGPAPRTRRYGFGPGCGRTLRVSSWKSAMRSFTPTLSWLWRRFAERWRLWPASLSQCSSRICAPPLVVHLVGDRPSSSSAGASVEFFDIWS